MGRSELTINYSTLLIKIPELVHCHYSGAINCETYLQLFQFLFFWWIALLAM